MRSIWVVALLLLQLGAKPVVVAEEKATSLSDARAAVEANLRTPEGKAFDEKLGTEFVAKHLAPIHQCKQGAGDDMRSFWMLIKLEQDGTVKEVLLYPETKLGICARAAYLKDRFPAPPRAAYWVSVYMKLAH